MVFDKEIIPFYGPTIQVGELIIIYQFQNTGFFWNQIGFRLEKKGLVNVPTIVDFGHHLRIVVGDDISNSWVMLKKLDIYQPLVKMDKRIMVKNQKHQYEMIIGYTVAAIIYIYINIWLYGNV